MGFKEEKIDDSNYFEGMEEILEENRVQNRALYICIVRSIRANKRELHAKINCSE